MGVQLRRDRLDPLVLERGDDQLGLALPLPVERGRTAPAAAGDRLQGQRLVADLPQQLEDDRALDRENGSISGAARAVGVNRATAYA